MTSLNGSTAWVWGGTSGIGLASAQAIARAGARVIVAGRSPQRLREALAALPSDAVGESVDAADAAAVAAAYAKHGTLDHLVVSIGASGAIGPYGALTEDALRRTFEGKFWAYQRVTLAGLAHLSGTGSITWVTGAAARAAMPGMSALAAGNGALHAMIGPMARDLAPRRVNGVSPGFIDTPYWERALDADARRRTYDAMASAAPVGRVGVPDDIAHAVRMVIENSFITGAIVDVDGGRRLV